ncbi:MAG: flavodoxin family protein [Bacilli bacterium]
MKIGIIVYSYTGNTFLVSQKLLQKLEEKHMDVTLLRIETNQNEEMDPSKVVLNNHLDVSMFDTFVFASPIRGFSLSAPFKKFLKDDFKEKNKQVYGFVTQFLPFNWCGPNQSNKFMKAILDQNGCPFKFMGPIKWKKRNREEQISQLVNNLVNELTQM